MSDIQAVEDDANELIAWAAGLFDADGSATSHLQRDGHVQAEIFVYQAGQADTPAVLLQFRDVVGCGTFLGPARGRLWAWRISRTAEIVRVATLLWPWLSPVKREQFMTMATRVGDGDLRSELTELWDAEPPLMELPSSAAAIAWAGGFFVGEGWFGCTRVTAASRWPQLRAAITQASGDDAPEVLLRFRSALDGLGSITGPYSKTSPWSRLPQYRWAIPSETGVKSLIDRLWPWLDESKRLQALTALAQYDKTRVRR